MPLLDAFVSEFPKLQEAWMSALLLMGAAFVAGWLLGRFMYGQRIEDLKGRLQRRDEQIADLRSQVDRASSSPSLAPDLEQRLAAVEPRRLTAPQMDTLRTAARRVSGGNLLVVSDLAVADSRDFGDQLHQIFSEAGWNVRRQTVFGPEFPSGEGLVVTMRDRASPAGEVVRSGLAEIGLQFALHRRAEGQFDESFDAYILVCAKS